MDDYSRSADADAKTILTMNLCSHRALFFKQRRELAELFGFETRNKYEIHNDKRSPIGFAAEQQKGIFGWLMRHFLGHWRTFDVIFFNTERQMVLKGHHPFRFFFQRLEVSNSLGQPIGIIQQRFAIFSKKFDVLNPRGMAIMNVSSPFWKFWTFPFYSHGQKVATVQKKWSGLLTEAFMDKDNFMIEFTNPSLTEDERSLILVAGLFIDLQYFEKKASS